KCPSRSFRVIAVISSLPRSVKFNRWENSHIRELSCQHDCENFISGRTHGRKKTARRRFYKHRDYSRARILFLDSNLSASHMKNAPGAMVKNTMMLFQMLKGLKI